MISKGALDAYESYFTQNNETDSMNWDNGNVTSILFKLC